MSKSLKASLRKGIVGIVMMTTIFSLSGVAALVPVAQAATIIKDGDVIRNPSATGDAQFDVYIVKLVGAKKFKRLVLNPQVFNSYGHLKWSNIKTVTTEEMNSYKTSAIVRVETDPKVLALAPNGDAGSKSWLNVPASDFVAAGGDWDSVYVINATDGANYAAAADLTTQAQVVTFLTAGTLPGGAVPVTGAITVSLAANTPATATLVTSAGNGSQGLAPITNLNFANGTSAEVKVTTLNLTRVGIASDTDLSNVYLYDGNTRLAEVTSVSSRVFSFVNASGLFTLSANATKTILVKADLVNDATGLSGKTIGLGVNAAADVVTSGGTVGGTFPVNGNLMNTAIVTDIGRFAIGTTAPTAPATADPGQTGKEIFRVSASASNQNLDISYLKFTNVGTIAATDLANIKLMDSATQIGTTVANLAADGTAVFDLSASPLRINSGVTKSLVITADIVSGTNRTFKMTVQRQSDIIVKDTNYGINVRPYTDGTTETFAVIQPAAATNITTGTLAIGVDSSSPSGNVALGSTNITLAKFKVVASGEAVKIVSLPVVITIGGTTPATTLKNVKLVLDGTQVGTTQATVTSGTAVSAWNTGDFGNSLIIPAGTTGKILSVVADIREASGTALAADHTITAALTAGSLNAQGQVSLTSISTGASNGRLLTVASGTMSAAKNLAVANGTSTTPNGVKGAVGSKIGSFVLTAGSGEGVSVSQIRVKDIVTDITAIDSTVNVGLNANGTGKTIDVASTTAFVVGEAYYVTDGTAYETFTVTEKTSATQLTGTVSGLSGTLTTPNDTVTINSPTGTDTLADTFQNLKLMMGATQVGTTVTSLTDTAGSIYTFTPATAISIAAGQQVVFDILADVKSGATTLSVNSSTGITQFYDATATGVITATDASYSTVKTLQNVYIAGTGVVTVAVNSDTPTGAQVVMGTTGVEIAKFKLSETSNGEAVNLTQISIKDTVGVAANVGTLSNVQLFDGATLLGSVASLTLSTNDGVATYNGLNLTVPRGQNKILTVKADITPYDGGVSNSTHKIKITGFAGTGVSSGSSLATAASGDANTMTAYRTKVTVAYASDSPSGASSGAAGQTVAKFTVSNSDNVGSYEATVRQIKPTISSTIVIPAAGVNTTVSRYVKIYKNSITTGNLLATIDFCTYNGTGTCTASTGTTTLVNLGTSTGAFTTSNLAAVDTAFTDFTVAAKSSVTLIVTADTQDAASAKNFSLSIGADQGTAGTFEVGDSVVWSDGITGLTSVTTGIIDSVDGLPIASVKTLQY